MTVSVLKVDVPDPAQAESAFTTNRRWWKLDSFSIVRRLDLRQQDLISPVPIDMFANRLTDPLTRAVLIDMIRHVAGEWLDHSIAPSDARLRSALVDISRRGLLVVLAPDHERRGHIDGDEQAEPPKPPPPPTPRRKVEKTWVEFRLVDQLQRPVASARYRLKITDGSVREGRLDADGCVRVAGIEPGTCEICFLDFGKNEWRRL